MAGNLHATDTQAGSRGLGDCEEAAAAGAPLRVAYFPDSFHEINGVAHTSRQFEAFARRRQLPFLCVRAGRRAEPLETSGTVHHA